MHREKLEKSKQEAEEKTSDRRSKGKNKESATPWGDTELPDLDRQRLKRAMDEEKKRKAMGEDEAWQHTKKRKTDVTEEDMEAYRLSKQAYDDPMANYKDPEED